MNRAFYPLLFLLILLSSCRDWDQLKGLEYPDLESIEHDGMERKFRLFVPSVYTGVDPVPLVICLHGGGGNSKNMIKLSFGGFNELAEMDTFLVVYPEGIGKSWNDGREVEAIASQEQDIDDVGFISSLIDHLSGKYSIDPNRIYATGISNGGFMSFRLACELSDKISAIAPVAACQGELISTTCSPVTPVPVLMINGTEDPLVGWDTEEVMVNGNARGRKLTVMESFAFWQSLNLCDSVATTTTDLPDLDPEDGTIVQLLQSGCADSASVWLYQVNNGGHTWPQGWRYLGERTIGITSQDINATEVIWAFFKAH